jgi:seryl-tRNA synthetase
MLDIKTLRQDPDSVTQALEKRGIEFDLPAFSALDARRKEADVRVNKDRRIGVCRRQRRGSKGPSR